MSTKRNAALVVIGIFIAVLLLAANVVVALDRTALDAEYAKETAADVELHETFAEEIRADVAGGDDANADDSPIDRSEGELLADAITDEYVRTQLEANIDNVYDYLHGRSDELRIEFDTEPLEERLLAEAEDELEEIDLAALEMPYGEEIEAMAASQATFDEHREAFRTEQKERIQAETERELDDDELETRLEESMDERREEMLTELDAELEGRFDGPDAALEEPVRDLQTARIDALTGALTYDEYVAAVEAATDDLREAFLASMESELEEELPESVDLTEEMDDEQLEMLETARTAVSVTGPLALGLSVLVLFAVGGVVWLTPREIAAISVGVVAAIVGLIGVVGAAVATSQLRASLDGEAATGMDAFFLEFVIGIFGAVSRQSVVLLVVGVGLLAVGIAISREYLELD